MVCPEKSSSADWLRSESSSGKGQAARKVEAEFTALAATVNGTWGGFTGVDMSGHLVGSQNKTFIRETTMKANP